MPPTTRTSSGGRNAALAMPGSMVFFGLRSASHASSSWSLRKCFGARSCAAVLRDDRVALKCRDKLRRVEPSYEGDPQDACYQPQAEQATQVAHCKSPVGDRNGPGSAHDTARQYRWCQYRTSRRNPKRVPGVSIRNFSGLLPRAGRVPFRARIAEASPTTRPSPIPVGFTQEDLGSLIASQRGCRSASRDAFLRAMPRTRSRRVGLRPAGRTLAATAPEAREQADRRLKALFREARNFLGPPLFYRSQPCDPQCPPSDGPGLA